ncbi:MAG: Gfo/Idh/MocA family oxidoreductase, partial [Acidobacteria bacterium]|nr:Gfo/Idh/MocA family oxidoreductase [Acidobacteriota bacterium]
MPSSSPSRRHFFLGPLFTAAIPAAGFGTSASLTRLGYKSPNELLNIAAIGAGGKGNSDLAGCATENIVALCDVDDRRASRPYAKYPRAARYRDFRQMLDKEARNIDAVIIATPDHTHAVATLACMQLGKHVYTQKPLTRTIHEARELTRAAARYKVATQMGNQGYSNEGTRQCAELIWSGAIGPVREVHAWTNRPIWPQGFAETPKPEPVPTGVDWNLWLGPAAKRPYSSAYMPWTWRGFYDFGCGALGDMACHILGAPNMALLLGAPTSVECTHIEGRNDLTYPTRSILRFDFPARPAMPPVTIYWYD